MISYNDDGFCNVFKIVFVAFAVLLQRQIHLCFAADIIHYLSFVLSFKLAVYP